MNKKIIALIGAVALLSACETASQKAVTSSTASSSGSASASSSVDKKKSLFAQAKQTAADKLIAVGDRVLFDYDSAKLWMHRAQLQSKQSVTGCSRKSAKVRLKLPFSTIRLRWQKKKK